MIRSLRPDPIVTTYRIHRRGSGPYFFKGGGGEAEPVVRRLDSVEPMAKPSAEVGFSFKANKTTPVAGVGRYGDRIASHVVVGHLGRGARHGEELYACLL